MIFDHDGVLVDSIQADFLAWSTLFAEWGVELPTQVWARACGLPLGGEALLERLASTSPRAGDKERLRDRLSELWDLFLTPDNVTVVPGVPEFLTHLSAAGFRLAVASAASRNWVGRWLRHYDLAHHFETVVGADDVPAAKPDPAVYLEAARRLGVAPAACVAFEDSLAGVAAAKAAGMTVVAVPTPLTRALDYSAADHVVRQLADVPPHLLRPHSLRAPAPEPDHQQVEVS
ncbi:HAD family hydrolase [Streptoalloteichus tenebrarius]|uniref:HAD family hydrolase n=1 Tax=Streptoalloteichus tenebrarius (strain ATCC 17920 / DSM 40477 / JCM 4838 / CBS 697.72 / NBRC 16177 / NCIMB 11028 / NRRL B-12390 / A12253. 1 / ISP 5477) TaxID=1933 RepID=UPI0020A4B16B|nr:HAD family phosphatase [Streptoalloteichus tenebrarius]